MKMESSGRGRAARRRRRLTAAVTGVAASQESRRHRSSGVTGVAASQESRRHSGRHRRRAGHVPPPAPPTAPPPTRRRRRTTQGHAVADDALAGGRPVRSARSIFEAGAPRKGAARRRRRAQVVDRAGAVFAPPADTKTTGSMPVFGGAPSASTSVSAAWRHAGEGRAPARRPSRPAARARRRLRVTGGRQVSAPDAVLLLQVRPRGARRPRSAGRPRTPHDQWTRWFPPARLRTINAGARGGRAPAAGCGPLHAAPTAHVTDRVANTKMAQPSRPRPQRQRRLPPNSDGAAGQKRRAAAAAARGGGRSAGSPA